MDPESKTDTEVPEKQCHSLVVHCKKEDYDVYIGRGFCPKTSVWSIWGNPFALGPDGTREEVISKYREWIVKQPGLMKQVRSLHGLRLGCWCAPRLCHGDVLVELSQMPEEPVQ